MAQDDEFFIDGRTSKRSGSQGSPKTRTSKGGAASQPIVKLGALSGGSMSFTKRLAKDMAIAKRSSGRRTYAKPSCLQPVAMSLIAHISALRRSLSTR